MTTTRRTSRTSRSTATCWDPGVRGEFIRPSSAFGRPGVRDVAVDRVAVGGVAVGGGPAEPYRRCHRVGGSGGTSGRRPNYAARRCLAALGLIVAIAVAVPLVGAVMSSLGGAPAVAAEASSPAAGAVATTHVAQPGDTMWSIASRYRGEVAQDRYVDALIRLNGGTAIQAGQAVSLP